MSFFFKASAKSREDAIKLVMAEEGNAKQIPSSIKQYMCEGINNINEKQFVLNPGDALGFHLECNGHLAHGNDYNVTEAKVKVEPFTINTPAKEG